MRIWPNGFNRWGTKRVIVESRWRALRLVAYAWLQWLPLVLIMLQCEGAVVASERWSRLEEASESVGWVRPSTMASFSDPDVLLVGDRAGRIRWLGSSPLAIRGTFDTSSQRIVSLVATGSDRGWCLSQEPNRLVHFRLRDEAFESLYECDLSFEPTGMVVDAEGERIAIASRWSRTIQVLSWKPSAADAEARLTLQTNVALSFEPGEMVWLSEGRLMVAAAFGGQVALVSGVDGRLLGVGAVDGHGIGGMAVHPSAGDLYLVHSRLDQERPITRVAIEFGDTMKHLVTWMSAEQLEVEGVGAEPIELKFAKGDELGFTGTAATDPGACLWLDEDTLVIALEGVGEVLLYDRPSGTESRMVSAHRPVALAGRAGGRELLVLHDFAASLQRFDIPTQLRTETLKFPSSGARTASERGEVLFFDASLARDRWMSCHTCHTDGHTNHGQADTMGDGSHGTPKRTLSLLGVGQTGPWGWSGLKSTLSEQVGETLRLTLHSDRVQDQTVADLVAYLETLPAGPAMASTSDEALFAAGERLFNSRGCVDCHKPVGQWTSKGRYEVGLEDEEGMDRFNPPSLRGALRLPGLFHDQRASSISEVLNGLGHGESGRWSETELRWLVVYLGAIGG